MNTHSMWATGPLGHRSLYVVDNPKGFRRGGVGIVYQARLNAERHGLGAGTAVGLKLLTALDADRFGKLSARLEILRAHPHPRLAQPIETFIGPPIAQEAIDEADADLFFSAHEWVEGDSLDRHLADASPAQILAWMSDIAEAIDHLHSLPGGFAHRDIHSRNIIIEPSGRARLIDFDTILWGEAADTVLTSLQSAPRLSDDGSSTLAQAQDRTMLALTLLRALAGDGDGVQPLHELAGSMTVSKSKTDGGSHDDAPTSSIVGYLLRCMRLPPKSATDIVDGARRLVSKDNPGRIGRPGRRFDINRELALIGDPSEHPGQGRGKRTAVAATVIAVIGGIFFVANGHSNSGTSTVRPLDNVALRAAAISTGPGAACLVEATKGTPWCWGRADGSYLNVAAPSVPSPVAYVAGVADGGGNVGLFGGDRVMKMAIGAHHRCAVTETRALYCWGADDHGQLGVKAAADGPANWSDLPVPVSIKDVTDVVASGDTTCAVAAPQQSVYCWGDSVMHDGTFVPRPALVAGLTGVDAITYDGHMPCGLKSGGAVFCWGDPNQPAPTEMTGVPAAAAISGTCAITTKSALYCWGGEPWHTDGSTQPNGVQKIATFGTVAQFGAGDNFACALTTQGKVLCAGSNGVGQLGRNDIRSSAQPVSVNGLDPVVSLSVGPDFACAISRDGSAHCWGGNESSQLSTPISASGQPTLIVMAVPKTGWLVRTDGYGPLTLGMTASDAVATGMVMRVNDTSCGIQWSEVPGLTASGVRVSFTQGGEIGYIRFGKPDLGWEPPVPQFHVKTLSGLSVGSSLSDAHSAYPSLETSTWGDAVHEEWSFASEGENTLGVMSLDHRTVHEIALLSGSTVKQATANLPGGC